jgi:hypothetical protein
VPVRGSAALEDRDREVEGHKNNTGRLGHRVLHVRTENGGPPAKSRQKGLPHIKLNPRKGGFIIPEIRKPVLELAVVDAARNGRGVVGIRRPKPLKEPIKPRLGYQGNIAGGRARELARELRDVVLEVVRDMLPELFAAHSIL